MAKELLFRQGAPGKQENIGELDSANGTRFSEERFRAISGWTPEDLAGKLVLDAGCGTGALCAAILDRCAPASVDTTADPRATTTSEAEK